MALDLEALVVAGYVFADEFPVPARPGPPARISDAELVTLAVCQERELSSQALRIRAELARERAAEAAGEAANARADATIRIPRRDRARRGADAKVRRSARGDE
jgi:hypothetical protein